MQETEARNVRGVTTTSSPALIDRDSAISHGHGMGRAREGGKFVLELATFLTRPVIHLVRQEHARYGICFFVSESGPGGKRSVEH